MGDEFRFGARRFHRAALGIGQAHHQLGFDRAQRLEGADGAGGLLRGARTRPRTRRPASRRQAPVRGSRTDRAAAAAPARERAVAVHVRGRRQRPARRRRFPAARHRRASRRRWRSWWYRTASAARRSSAAGANAPGSNMTATISIAVTQSQDRLRAKPENRAWTAEDGRRRHGALRLERGAERLPWSNTAILRMAGIVGARARDCGEAETGLGKAIQCRAGNRRQIGGAACSKRAGLVQRVGAVKSHRTALPRRRSCRRSARCRSAPSGGCCAGCGGQNPAGRFPRSQQGAHLRHVMPPTRISDSLQGVCESASRCPPELTRT